MTERKTNPLMPDYIFPGQVELVGKNNNPYGKTLEEKEPKKVRNFKPEKIEEKKKIVVMEEKKDDEAKTGSGEVLGFNNQFYEEEK